MLAINRQDPPTNSDFMTLAAAAMKALRFFVTDDEMNDAVGR